MRKFFLTLLGLAGAVFVFLAFAYSAAAQSYPEPLPQQILTSKHKKGDVKITLWINSNKGYVSSKDINYGVSEFWTEYLNPHAFNYSQNFNLSWEVEDSTFLGFGKEVKDCSLIVDSQDSGNSFSSGQPISNTGGSMNYSTAVMPAGNYLFSLWCNLKNGTRLNDFIYVYLLPNAVTPAPLPKTFPTYGYIDSGVRSILGINMNQGHTSARGITSPSVNTGVINPIAFSGKQPFNFSVTVTGYSSWGGGNIAKQDDNLLAMSVLLFLNPGSGVGVNSCQLTVRSVDSNSSITTLTIPPPNGGSVINESVELPMTLMPGNYWFHLTCNLSNGRTIGDMIYAYVVGTISGGGGQPPPGGGPPPPPLPPPPPPTSIQGSHDESSCVYLARGWVRDGDVAPGPTEVHIYVDGPADGVRPPVDAILADDYRGDPAPPWLWPDDRNHGFTYPLPGVLRDGQDHTVYVYAIDINAGGNKTSTNPHLNGTGAVGGKVINCPPSSPPVIQPGNPYVDLKVEKK